LFIDEYAHHASGHFAQETTTKQI